MRLLPLNQLAQSERVSEPTQRGLLQAIPWYQLAGIAALSLWLFGPVIVHRVGQWWHNPDFSHGFFVPLFSAFVVWQERERLAQIPLRPSWSGLAQWNLR